MQLDEKALRREGFTGGVAVKLGDGQQWTFPRPRLVLCPSRNPDGTTEAKKWLTYGSSFQKNLDAFFDVPKDDYIRRLEIQVTLAADLLLENYDLDDRALETLLPYDQSDNANVIMWEALSNVMLCIPPKPSADGSD